MMTCPDYLTHGLEKTYEIIYRERMQGVPVLNERLCVKAVGFRQWQGNCLGALVTPWFINLMLLPAEGDAWKDLRVGEKVHHRFPSGLYEFIVGHEEGIGHYQMCSLFSPVFQFEDQEAAVTAARASLNAIMDEENRDTCGFDEKQVERIWRGEESVPDCRANQDSLSGTNLQEVDESIGMSRRTFITGGLSGAGK